MNGCVYSIRHVCDAGRVLVVPLTELVRSPRVLCSPQARAREQNFHISLERAKTKLLRDLGARVGPLFE